MRVLMSFRHLRGGTRAHGARESARGAGRAFHVSKKVSTGVKGTVSAVSISPAANE